MAYELRYAYTSDATLGESDVRSRHEDLGAAALAFVRCSAPFKQLLYEDEWGEPRWLDEREEAVVARVAATFGLEIDQVDGDAA